MIAESFGERIIANMEVALDRACKGLVHGGDHEVRRKVARAILECARGGDTTLNGLTVAGRRVASKGLSSAA